MYVAGYIMYVPVYHSILCRTTTASQAYLFTVAYPETCGLPPFQSCNVSDICLNNAL